MEIPAIRSEIQTNLAEYRKAFPKLNLTPKQHILEDHILLWIEKYDCGMALNELDKRMNGIRNDLNRMTASMTEHLTTVKPELTIVEQKQK